MPSLSLALVGVATINRCHRREQDCKRTHSSHTGRVSHTCRNGRATLPPSKARRRLSLFFFCACVCSTVVLALHFAPLAHRQINVRGLNFIPPSSLFPSTANTSQKARKNTTDDEVTVVEKAATDDDEETAPRALCRANYSPSRVRKRPYRGATQMCMTHLGLATGETLRD